MQHSGDQHRGRQPGAVAGDDAPVERREFAWWMCCDRLRDATGRERKEGADTDTQNPETVKSPLDPGTSQGLRAARVTTRPGQRCGEHDVANYLARVKAMER